MNTFCIVIKTSYCRDGGHIPTCLKVFQTHSCTGLWYSKIEFNTRVTFHESRDRLSNSNRECRK